MQLKVPFRDIGKAQGPTKPAPPQLNHAELALIARINMAALLVLEYAFAECRAEQRGREERDRLVGVSLLLPLLVAGQSLGCRWTWRSPQAWQAVYDRGTAAFAEAAASLLSQTAYQQAVTAPVAAGFPVVIEPPTA
jgi:hypothetical protein